jgi:hypothetical protein
MATNAHMCALLNTPRRTENRGPRHVIFIITRADPYVGCMSKMEPMMDTSSSGAQGEDAIRPRVAGPAHQHQHGLVDAGSRLSQWGQHPSFNSFQKLFAVQLLHHTTRIELPNAAFGFEIYGRPIRKAEVVGIVRGISQKAKRTLVTVDDGTEVVDCLRFFDSDEIPPFQGLEIGNLVSVKGSIIMIETNTKPYGISLQIKKLEILEDPNEEILHWLAVIDLHSMLSE